MTKYTRVKTEDCHGVVVLYPQHNDGHLQEALAESSMQDEQDSGFSIDKSVKDNQENDGEAADNDDKKSQLDSS